MSKTLQQIFTTNPITSNLSTDLMYFVQSPYTPGTDAGMTYANFAAQFASSSAIINPAHGGTGINNGLSTITIGGNFAMSGAFSFTGTLTGPTTVTFPTSGTLATTSQLPVPAALTESNDTNVTLTLGGTPATALLQATSITAGWTGTLSGTRGGTGVNNGANTITLGGNISTANSFTTSGNFGVTQTYTGLTNVTFPTSGTLATTSQLPTPAALTSGNDTNVTLTLGGTPATALLQAASITAGWTGQLSLTRGGTNASLTASNGGIIYSTASAFAVLSGTATANQLLLSGSSSTPSWSTSTYPSTNAANTLLYASSANTMAALATANSGVLVTSGAGVPSILAAGTTGQHLQASSAGTPSWTTNTYPATNALGDIFYGSATNVLSMLAGNITTTKQYLSQTGNGSVSAAPAWATIAGTDITGAALTQANDTNVTLTLGGTPSTALLRAASITAGWTGTLAGSRGGLGAAITASNGGIYYSNASNGALLSGTATANQVLLSGASTTPAWSTATYPATAGTAGKVLISDGTNIVSSTPTFPNASATSRKIIVSDGTNWVASTETWAVPGTSGNVLTSNGTNWTSAAASSVPSGTMFNFQQTQLTTPVTTTSTAFSNATGLSVTITPTSSSNTVLVRAVVQAGVLSSSNVGFFQLTRGSTAIGVGTSIGSRTAMGAAGAAVATSGMFTVVMEWLDSPATTSATTYNVQFASQVNAVTVAINASELDTNATAFPRTASTISVCEIHA